MFILAERLKVLVRPFISYRDFVSVAESIEKIIKTLNIFQQTLPLADIDNFMRNGQVLANRKVVATRVYQLPNDDFAC